MSGLRLEIDLDRIGHNAAVLVERAARRDISITAVTKATLGSAEIARVVSAAGATALADSRIDNLERLLDAGIGAPLLLLRSPMVSQIDRIVACGAMSVNTEVDVLSALASSARSAGRVHDVMLMVELGDLREGVMADQLHDTARHVLDQPALRLRGIGANLACRNGIEPSVENMGELSRLVGSVETAYGVEIEVVSGGNSANVGWAFGARATGRINNLRLGESILLGREPLGRQAIDGLDTTAFALVGEVIESKRKPTRPWGRSGQNSFGERPVVEDRGRIWQTILAIGRQDTDTEDLTAPDDVEILASSSDHLIVETRTRRRPGTEISFEPGYSALLRSMTSPFVGRTYTSH